VVICAIVYMAAR